MKNYYDILGVKPNASKDDIKKAFHKLAHKYHPDKRDGDEAKFKEVNEAYQTLSDEKKRRQYDAFGQSGTGAGFGADGFDGGWDFSNFAGGFSAEGGPAFGWDLGEMFGDLFSGRGGGRRRGRDISVAISVSFAEAIFGAKRQVLINKLSVCQTCGGNGAAADSKQKNCSACNGQGKIRETRKSFLGTFTTVRTCSICGGRGQVPETPCSACRGAGAVNRTEDITIVIPSGINDGEMIRLSGRGEPAGGGPGGVAGDLYVKVQVEKHKTLTRDGANLRAELEIKLSEALLGAERQVETLEEPATVKIPAGVNHGEILRLRGRGVPTGGGRRGDLLIRLTIKLPAKLSRAAKSLVEKLKEEGI